MVKGYQLFVSSVSEYDCEDDFLEDGDSDEEFINIDGDIYRKINDEEDDGDCHCGGCEECVHGKEAFAVANGLVEEGEEPSSHNQPEEIVVIDRRLFNCLGKVIGSLKLQLIQSEGGLR